MPRLSLYSIMVVAVFLSVSCTDDPVEPKLQPDVSLFRTATGNNWRAAAPMPTARFHHAAGFAKDAAGRQILYVFGGTDGDEDGFSTVEAYDPAADTWATRPFSPMIVSHLTQFNGVGRIGNRLYLPGGSEETGDGNICLTTLQVYDPVRNVWTRKADMPRNSCSGVAGVIDGRLYVLTAIETIDQDCPDCGSNSRLTRRLLRYNPATDKWVTLASCPNFHVKAMAGVIDGKLYVAGGGSDKLDIYDPATNLWSAGAPLPQSWSQGGAAVLGGRLYVIGGFSGTTVTDQVLAYNPTQNRWVTRAPLPTARNFLAADKVLLGGKPYIVAVGGELPLSGSDETDVYTP
jgi:N-acetylneuraminic acid mutarotase